MPFVITARQSGGGGSTGSPFTTSSDTPTANSLLLLGDGAQNDNTVTAQSHATPTGGGWTYTQIGSSPAQVNWAGENVYATTGALWQAAIGSSPSAHTITLDALPDTTNAIYRPIACDITGYNPAAPIKQYAQNAVDTNPGGGGTNASGSITLGATPSNGNLIIVYFFVCDDNGGPLTAPTMGAGKDIYPDQPVSLGRGSGHHVVSRCRRKREHHHHFIQPRHSSRELLCCRG